MEIQRSQYIKMWKLFKGGNYMREYGRLYTVIYMKQKTRTKVLPSARVYQILFLNNKEIKGILPMVVVVLKSNM